MEARKRIRKGGSGVGGGAGSSGKAEDNEGRTGDGYVGRSGTTARRRGGKGIKKTRREKVEKGKIFLKLVRRWQVGFVLWKPI